MRWTEIALRLGLTASLFGAVIYGVSVWIIAPLGLISIAVTSELAVRPYATNAADRLLLSCGAIVTTFIVIGLGLNLTPWGLTRMTWSLAWLVISIGVLIWRREVRTSFKLLPMAEWRALSLYMVSASLILIAAVILALAGVRQWDRKPVLALSVVSKSADAVVVEIEAASITGRYQISAVSSHPKKLQLLGPLLTVNAGSSGVQIRERVRVDTAGIWTINLKSVNSGVVARTVKVDVTR